MKKISLEDILKDWLSSSDSEAEELQGPESLLKLKNNSVIDKSLSSNFCSKETMGHRNNGVTIAGCKRKIQECGNGIKRNTLSSKRAIEEIFDLRSDSKTILSGRSVGKIFFNGRKNAEEISSCKSNVEETLPCKKGIKEISGCVSDTEETAGCKSNDEDITTDRTNNEEILPCKKGIKEISGCVSDTEETAGCKSNDEDITADITNIEETLPCKRGIKEISGCASDTEETTGCKSNDEDITADITNIEETLPCKKGIKEISGCVRDTEETTGCKSNDEDITADITNIEDTSDCMDNAEEIKSCRSNMKKNSICRSNIKKVLGFTKNTAENSVFRINGRKIPGGRCESDKSSGCISYPVVNLGFRCDDKDKTLSCSDSHNAMFVTSKFSFSSNDSKKLTSKATKVFEIATKGKRKMENNNNSILLKRKVHSKQGNIVKVTSQDNLRSSKTYKITSCHDNVPVFQEVKQKLEDENEIIYPIHKTEWDSKDHIEVAVIIDRNQECSSKNQIDNSSSVLNSGHENNTFDKTNNITNNIQKVDKKHKVNKSIKSKLCTGKSQHPEVVFKSSDNFSRSVSEIPDESKKFKKYETSQCTSDINLRINDVSSSSDIPVINSTEAREDNKTIFLNVELRNMSNPNDVGHSKGHKPIRKGRRKCNNFFVHKSKLCTEIKPHVKSFVDQATQITQDSHCELVSQLCFECKICHEKFATKLLLNRHTTMHEASEYFECDYCGYKSQRRGAFVRHIYMHQGKARHQCGICGKTFTYSQKYSYHLWSHRNDRPYNCDVCGKGYMQRESLYKHMSLHTGNIVKYDCSLCSKVFASRTGLNWHIRSFHRKETRCCPHCFNRYSVGNLGQHVKRCPKKNSC